MASVSVIIPCYNAAQTLEETVDSVLGQDLQGTQIIIVDDRSQDDTIGVAARIATRNFGRSIMVLRQPVNSGAGATRNVGFRHATAPYVVFLDADDLLVTPWLRLAVEYLDGHPEAGALSCGVELFDCHRPVDPLQLFAIRNSLPCNLVLRHSVVDFIGGFPEGPAFRGPTGGEDIQFRQAVRRWFRERSCDNLFFRYRVRQGSHFDRFLDRSYVKDGKLCFRPRPDLEAHEVKAAEAGEAYRQRIETRLALAAQVFGVPYPPNPAETLPPAVL